MATYNKFQDFVEALSLGEHNLNTDTLKAYLSNAAPSASGDADKADLAEITGGNGYTTGGHDIQNTLSETGGTATLTAVDITITATGGNIGPFQYVPIYNDTHTTDGLVGWYDYGSAITLTTGESFTIDFGASLTTLS